jgi:hypothetical protein
MVLNNSFQSAGKCPVYPIQIPEWKNFIGGFDGKRQAKWLLENIL